MQNIMVVGVFDKPSSSNIWMATALKRLNKNVIPINYRTVIQNYGYEFFENYLKYCVINTSPDLIIFSKCNGVRTELLQWCTQRTKTWLWFMDCRYILEKLPDVVNHMNICTYVSCTSEDTINYAKSLGINKEIHHIFEGVEPSVHFPVEPVEEYKADISFVGSKTELRDEIKKYLENDYVVKFYGPDYSGDWKNEEEWRKICASSKYILSVGTYNNIPLYFPGRVFEALGCKSCVLHYDPTESITDYFEDMKDLISFKHMVELEDKLLKADRDFIADHSYKTAMSKYTWKHSMEKLLSIAMISTSEKFHNQKYGDPEKCYEQYDSVFSHYSVAKVEEEDDLYRNKYKRIFSFFDIKNCKSIIDIGSSGYTSKFLLEINNNIDKILCIDGSKNLLNIFKNNVDSRVELLYNNFYHSFPEVNEKFDVGLHIDFPEHITDNLYEKIFIWTLDRCNILYIYTPNYPSVIDQYEHISVKHLSYFIDLCRKYSKPYKYDIIGNRLLMIVSGG